VEDKERNTRVADSPFLGFDFGDRAQYRLLDKANEGLAPTINEELN